MATLKVVNSSEGRFASLKCWDNVCAEARKRKSAIAVVSFADINNVLKEYSGHCPPYDPYIYFETDEAMTLFLLRFS